MFKLKEMDELLQIDQSFDKTELSDPKDRTVTPTAVESPLKGDKNEGKVTTTVLLINGFNGVA